MILMVAWENGWIKEDAEIYCLIEMKKKKKTIQ